MLNITVSTLKVQGLVVPVQFVKAENTLNKGGSSAGAPGARPLV